MDLRSTGEVGNCVTAVVAPAQLMALPPEWMRYRDCYVLLQHLRTLADGDATAAADLGRLALDLGLSAREIADAVTLLRTQGFVLDAGLRVSLTPLGVRYLERDHGRRRSVRPRRALSARPASSGARRRAPAAPSWT